jgi:hypothetical protein
MAEYLYKLGLKSLRWEQAGAWQRDARVSVTYLLATLADPHAPVLDKLGWIDWLSHCYEWKKKFEFSHTTKKWYSEIWVEYHSAPSEHRSQVLQTLEEVRIGEITYPVLLNAWAASTDVGVLATLLTAIGIFDISTVQEPEPPVVPTPIANRWSSYLVVNLPPGELSDNPNMPPYRLAHFVASMLRNPHRFFLMKTEVWVPLEVDLPLPPQTEARIRDLQTGLKWWR